MKVFFCRLGIDTKLSQYFGLPRVHNALLIDAFRMGGVTVPQLEFRDTPKNLDRSAQGRHGGAFGHSGGRRD